MKKKLFILFALTVTLFSLPFSFLLTANAEESTEPTISIEKFNLVFDDNVYLKYGVKFDGIEDENITSNTVGMLYFTEPQEEYIEGNASFSSSVVGHTTIDEVKYYTFEYRNLSAKQMTDYVYSVAYIDIDEARYYSEPVKYSVLDYAYAKLGKTGTASSDQEFKDMLSSMLVYGANAQRYFDYNTDKLADADYFLVEVVGGTLEDGFISGLYYTGESATLTAPEVKDGLAFASWVNSAGETVSKENPFILNNFTANETYTATYKKGLAFTSNGDGTCSVSGIGGCTDTDIVIPSVSPAGDRVTSIAQQAFFENTTITSVVMPDSVTTIGDGAFYGCKNLTSATLSNNLTSIGYALFSECTKLTSVVIPDSLTDIPMYTFYGCQNLTSVTIGNGVTTIGLGAFYDCGFTSVEIPDSVTTIGDGAFKLNANLTSVVMPDSVTSINDGAFDECPNLTSVYYKGTDADWSAISIGEYNSQLTDATRYSYSETKPTTEGNFWHYENGVATIWKEFYSEGLNFTSNKNGTCAVSGIGTCTDTKIVIPSKSPAGDSVTSIADQAFMNCTNMTDIILSNTITSVGSNVFYGCTSLTNINVKGNSAYFKSIDGNLYSKDGKTLVQYAIGKADTNFVIPDGVTAIGAYAVSRATNLVSVVIPDGVTTISTHSFSHCTNLTSVVMPNSVTSIASIAFYNDSKITDVYYKGTEAEWAAMSINSSNDPIKAATRYYYSASVPTNAGNFWHYVDGVITLWPGLLEFISNGDGTCSVKLGTCTDTAIVIPSVSPEGDSVTSIGDNAFKGNTTITSVVIPDSVTSIGANAFYNCKNLISVDIPVGVTSIGEYAFAYCKNLTGVVIPDSVTSIGSFAFSNLEKLTSVIIQDGVTSISQAMFFNCQSLTSIVIPVSVTSISDFAFYDCKTLANVYYEGTASDWSKISIDSDNTKLTGATRYYYSETKPTGMGDFWHYVDDVPTAWPVTYSKGLKYTSNGDGTCSVSGIGTCTDTNIIIPSVSPAGDSVTSINASAFYNIQSFTSVVIPDSVTLIGAQAFSRCLNLANIEVNDKNEYYKTVDGNLYSKDGKTLIQYAIGKETTSFVIPDGVTSIDANAVRYCTLTDITIGDSVTAIGEFAFSNSTSIATVIIGNSVTSIGNAAFYGCSITNVYYKGATSKWSNITINTNNDVLTDATRYYYSETEPTTSGYFWHYVDGVVTIWPLPFSAGLVYTSNGDGTCSVSGIGTCTDTQIVIPAISSNGDSVTSIGNNAFSSCSNVTSIEIPVSVTLIGRSAFLNCSKLTSIVIPDGVTSVGDSAFYGCTSLTSIVIPDSVTSVGDSAFYRCTSLTSIVIPNGVTSVGNNAFYGCTSLTDVVFHDNVTSIGQYAFYGCTSLTDVVIPVSVTSIDAQAFNNCQNLANVYYKGSASDWDNLTIDYDNDKFKKATHYCYSETEPTTIGKFWRYVDGVITVWPEFIPAERNLAFTSRNNGTCYVSGIGDYVDATEIEIPAKSPAGDTVTSIGANVFKGCTALTSIIIPDTVTLISNEVFMGCTALTSIEIPDTVTFIGSSVFQSCTALTSVKLSNQLTTISNSLFYSCSALESIEIPDSVTMISASAFRYCKKLSTVKLSNQLTDIGIYAFEGCTTLNSIELPSSLCSLANYSFRDCSALTSITIPQNVTDILKNTFENCSALTSVTLPNTLKSIGDSAFQKCIKLTSITIPASVTSIGASAFYQCTGLTTATINGGSIGSSAFYGCTKLKTVVMGNSVTSIGASAFYNCTALSSVTIGGAVLTIGESAFYGCSALKTIVIPAAVTRIEKYAFKGTSLTSATFEDTSTWYKGASATTNGSKVTVTNKTTNATNLKSSSAYYWNKT